MSSKRMMFSNFCYAIYVLLGLDVLEHKIYLFKRARFVKNELLKLSIVKKCRVKYTTENGRFTKHYLTIVATLNEAEYVADMLTDDFELEHQIFVSHLKDLKVAQMRDSKLDLRMLFN